MKTITNAMLKGACRPQRALFRRTWPKGAAINEANALKAARLGLDPDWAASRLLSPALYAECWAKCRRLNAEYWAKCKPLDYEYRAACWLALLPLLQKEAKP